MIDWEIVGAFAIFAFFAYVVWRSGSANPVGTGQLQKQQNTLGSEVSRIKKLIDGCATTVELNQLREELRNMEKRVASSGEVIALEGQIAAVNVRIEAMRETQVDTREGVRRIEAILMKGGFDR